jgi:hypothetical protein
VGVIDAKRSARMSESTPLEAMSRLNGQADLVGVESQVLGADVFEGLDLNAGAGLGDQRLPQPNDGQREAGALKQYLVEYPSFRRRAS